MWARRTGILWLIAGVAATLVLEGGGAAPYGIGSPRGPEAILLGERFTAGRLTGQAAWEPCVPELGEALVPRVRCGSPLVPRTRRFQHLRAVAKDLLKRLPADDSSAVDRARALWSLRRGDEPRDAIALLERAAKRSPDDARVLNDLAVAYLEQGAREQTLEPMLRALDAVERALARDSLRPEPLYNRAVIAERLYLVNIAHEAWLRYAAVEDDAQWKMEAGERARLLEPPGDTASWAALVDASPALEGRRRYRRIASRVAVAPKDARDFSFKLLGRWGGAVLAGDERRAASLLGWGRDIGAAFEAVDGDRTVALAVRAIDGASGSPDRVRALAEAHVALDSGFTRYTAIRYEEAAPVLRRAEAGLAAEHSAMAGWAAYLRAASLISSTQFASADTILRRIAGPGSAALPALAGRAAWARGTSRVRRGLYDEASEAYRAAAPWAARARESEYQGTVHALLSESLALTGQHVAARTEAYLGLRLLSGFGSSPYYATQLTTVAAEARDQGLRHAALAVMDERVKAARLGGGSLGIAQALRARARDRFAIGDASAARADLAEAWRTGMAIGPGTGQDRVIADVLQATAEIDAADAPRAALGLLHRVIRIYREQRLAVYLPGALRQAAAATRATGDLDGAHRSLGEAVELIEALQDSAFTPETRATRLETVENVFDAAIDVELARGRPNQAFAYLERARLAAWPLNERGARPAGLGPRAMEPADFAPTLPRGTLLLEYAVLHERLVVWAVSRGRVRQWSAPVSRDSVARLVEGYAHDGYSSHQPGDAGARLFELLVRPVAQELRGIRHLAVVPDRELNRVPFAALHAGRGEPRLVDGYAITTLPSTAFYLAARRRAGTRPARAGRALVVGEPATDPALQLDSLPDAAREADAVAQLRSPSTLLKGADARRGELLRLLPRSTLFHFAGHAVFNAEQPELSYLALAPDSAGDPGIIRAWEIAKLPASNLMTVVLSACSTLNPRPTHAGAPAGLAYSFLRAGAPSTVSTLWDVSDQTTIGVVVEFHRRAAAGVPPAEALRQAQMAALGSSRSAPRAPVAWAAFIYTGP